MADEKGTLYRVGVKSVVEGGESEPDKSRESLDPILGIFRGHGPKQAVDAALEARGMPNAKGGTLVAVPVANWHEFPVEGREATIYTVGERIASDQIPGQTAIDVPPAEEESEPSPSELGEDDPPAPE